MGAFSSQGGNSFPPLWVICIEGCKATSGGYLREIAWAHRFLAYFFTCFLTQSTHGWDHTLNQRPKLGLSSHLFVWLRMFFIPRCAPWWASPIPYISSWCYSGQICFHHEGSELSCCAWVDTCFFTPLDSSYWQVNIVLLANDTHTLADVVVIADPMWLNLVACVAFIRGDNKSLGERKSLSKATHRWHISTPCDKRPINVYISQQIASSGSAHTWHGWWKALVALLYQFCVVFTNKKFQWCYKNFKPSCSRSVPS